MPPIRKPRIKITLADIALEIAIERLILTYFGMNNKL